MPEKEVKGVSISVNDEGYMTDHSQWTPEVAAGLAEELDITLTDAHWQVLDFIAKDFPEKDAVPGMRRMNKIGGIPTKELYALFPNGPIKKAALISGFPKPTSCV